ncbi:MAG TPA: 50S ribosomal protein L6 [Patescibacteria group bacterium]|nr:50S ribosomal protein L6 [Patescibacteria group bacterium]
MSRIGNAPITIAAGVSVHAGKDAVTVEGPEGKVVLPFPSFISIEQEGKVLFVKNSSLTRESAALQGLMRACIANAVAGTGKKWERRLRVVGTGYKVKLQGDDLIFTVGFSHPVVFKKVEGVSFIVEGSSTVVVKGVDKQLVGEVAYKIKRLRKPDPYKGKGIRYEGEQLKLKPGKKAKAAGPVK